MIRKIVLKMQACSLKLYECYKEQKDTARGMKINEIA